ncbi:MAG: hypothetical protein DI569_02555 [Sphingopyxis macrogoltabida]|uniref:Uncharacterized protein n=1 Tax=Sphingopyxis macrogoltabida TaxID=33050 RepID=A0A2W5L3I1_SPHMC|nr:MAG: hypothetical protein DI569_02555 [Sphingopyxis macrogoltabida]
MSVAFLPYRHPGFLPYRHPGLDPGSIAAAVAWTPDQVRGDGEGKTPIANEVAQFSGPFA